MSSAPFQLGVPIVDSLPNENGTYILRTRNEEDALSEINRLRKNLTKNDLIKVYYIGYRPDNPIPVSRYFTEICIDIGYADVWMSMLPVSLYNFTTTGVREPKEKNE